VKSAVQFVRAKAADFGLDPARVALVPRRSDYDSLSWASRVAAAGSG
jgi:hypothetical protein